MKRRRAQRGVTLVETLVAMVLMLVIVASILGAFSSVALTARRHQVITTLDRLARSDVEFNKRQAYRPKAMQPYAQLGGLPAGYSFTMTVAYWDPVRNNFLTTNPESGLQQVQLTVRGPSNTTETVYFLRVQP